MTTPNPDFAFATAAALVDRCLELDYFYSQDDADSTSEVPIPSKWVPADGKLIVVTGENASGKSFLRRIIQGVCSAAKVECMHLSMQKRTSAGIQRAFIYGGSEDEDATGQISAGVVLAGIRNCKTRENPHVIIWDEPDLGLSEGAAAGVGAELREFVPAAPAGTVAIVVISHSKPLVRELAVLNPHFLSLGDELADSLTDWLQRTPIVRRPQELVTAGRHRRKLIGKILNSG